MSVFNCYYVTDAPKSCLFELVSTRDHGVLHVKNLQVFSRSQQQVIAHSQYFVYITLSGNLSDRC
jgi:hypothetical protein